jgi:hypothetical protein
MSKMQLSGYIGGRHDDGIMRLAGVTARCKAIELFPVLIPFAFYLSGIIYGGQITAYGHKTILLESTLILPIG